MIPNILRKKIRLLVDTAFRPFWSLYYTHGSCCAPKSKYKRMWIKDPENCEWDYLHYGEFYDPICFPLPFKINCIGCMGCANNQNPLLSPDKPKGPYKIQFSETFCKQYEKMAGKAALVELLYKTEKENEMI